MKKAEYRDFYKQKRLSISDQNKELMDQQILDQLIAKQWSDIKYLHIYIPIQKFKEPDTLNFVSFLKESFSDLKIVISKTDFATNEMVNFLWDEDLVLEENKWGILEPLSGSVIAEDMIDAVLVPLLVVDEQGNRVGYGKGFYDRFLMKCKSSIKKIGLSYFEPVAKIEDVEVWDVPINSLVTPQRVYSF